MSFAGNVVKGVRLEGLGRRPSIGSAVERRASDIKGGDGAYSVKVEHLNKFRRKAILECSPMGRGKWKRRILDLVPAVPVGLVQKVAEKSTQEWKGFEFDTIFTDGSL